ncbi:MAG TPA: protein kinase [Terriglobales bacterium]|nr:protein kinase [Terriglobales bacterium]
MPNEAARAQWTPEGWRHLRELLATLIDTPPEGRPAFLADACGDDIALRMQLEDLLRAHEATGAAGLDHSPLTSVPLASARAFESVVGRRIGAYRIESEIAHGGMGTVYRAIRADHAYEKCVAIKLVDRAVLSRRSAELFRHERQILAKLEHPNIARLLDGGTHDDGSPYLVMEFVEGEPIARYCDVHRLAIEERLKLFQKICSAVHFAHQNLVIHRDIKPANILVTSEGEPKLLDFGIAKIVDAGSAKTTQTFGAMTPAYASPEQLCGQGVTTSTDIYSLGLVLYELLTGRYAFERCTSPARRQQAILDGEPERPSRAVLRQSVEPDELASSEQIGALRQLPPEKLSKRLQGDLESIVAKAICREPDQRYSSVAQFSEDISRHLRGEPVIAHRSTFFYRCTKFIRRHTLGVAAAALVLALVGAGLALIIAAERRARAQEALAEQRFNDVRKLANSLIFEVHDSIQNLPGATAAKKLIAQRAQEYLDGLAAESKSDPGLLRELAAAYRRLASAMGNGFDANTGESERALQNYRRAMELREVVVALVPASVDAKRDLAQSYLDVAFVTAQSHEKDKEKGYYDKALAILEPLAAANPQDPKVQYGLAKALERQAGSFTGQGKFEEAKANYNRSLTIYQHLVDSEPQDNSYRSEVAFSHKHLGGLLATQSQRDQLKAGLDHYRAALAIDEELLKADPQNVNSRYAITFTYSDIGYILGKLGDVDTALNYYRKAFKIRSALVSADPQDTRARGGLANTYGYVAGLLSKKGKLEEALEDEKQAFRIRKTLSDNDPTNDSKQLSAMWSAASVGNAYAQLAFSSRTNHQNKVSLCQQAESCFQNSMPELLKRKREFLREDANYLEEIQQSADRCLELSQPHAQLSKATRPH